jgi:hypothetical protein
MASLLGSFTESMSSDAISKLSRAVGLDSGQAMKGLDVVGPLLLGSLAKKSQTTSGMDSIMKMLPETGGGLLSFLTGSSGSQAAAASSSLLSSVLGPGTSTIGKALGGRLGFDATPLLSAAAPALLGMIGTTAKEQKLNSVDIAKMLQTESDTAMATAKPEVQAVLTEAFKLGDRAEKLKASFSDDEWNTIQLAPVAAAFYVVSASVSGVKGVTKEVVAGGEALKTIVKDALPTSLVDVAYGGFQGKLELQGPGFDEASPRSSALDALKAASAAVRAKSPADAKSFGDTLVGVARKVAEAAKEGGVLGFGGTLVTKEEEMAISEIAAAVA